MSVRSHIPPCPATPQTKPSSQAKKYEIKLITPLFGGGVIAREVDPGFLIRPTTIRGQLQFWWRATVGAQYKSLSELRAAQSNIWGDTSQSSRVQVRVEIVSKESPKPYDQLINEHKNNPIFKANNPKQEPWKIYSLPYALFPFQGQLGGNNKVPPAKCIHKAAFSLILNLSPMIDFEKEVEPALWAWINFGGIGSRTRRGCGSLFCSDFSPDDKNDFEKRCKKYISSSKEVREWPTLASTILCSEIPSSSIAAWSCPIALLRNFRQGVGLGRNEGTQRNRPGRSRFPEPETIRRIMKKKSTHHQGLEHIPDNAFPRAEFGLPIIFHFQNDEVEETSLYPDKDKQGNPRERMASPLILKALGLKDGRALPLIVRLNTLPLTGVDLRHKNVTKTSEKFIIRDQSLAKYTNSPLKKSTTGSALEAFLNYAKENSFKEVSQ